MPRGMPGRFVYIWLDGQHDLSLLIKCAAL